MATFTTESSECGWEPFLDWLRSHNVDPHLTKQVTVDGDQATVVMFRLDTEGRKYMAPGTSEPVTETRTFTVHTPPPRRVLTGGR